MKKRDWLGGLAAVLLAGAAAASPAYAKEAVIPEGIFAGGISLGGMTKEAAQKELKDYTDGLSARRIILEVDGNEVETTAGELGFSWDSRAAADQAAAYTVEGNLIQQYMELKDLEKEPVELSLEAEVDETAMTALIQEKTEGLVAAPRNASITRADGKFEITPGEEGKTVDIEAAKTEILQALSGAPEGDVTVEAPVSVKEPEITEEQLATIGDVLGTFSTDFSSSSSSRAGNLKNGAGKINGHLLMPGESLSGYECMHPFTKENGYYSAAAYENGQVVDSIGGGVCQISTTLYQAALRAELEITQRQNHSMIVTYVQPSMDAAIAGTYKDLKVTNNYSTPIYVEGYTSGRTLTFTFYGKETRPANRTIEFVSETLSRISPGAPQERVDRSLAPGARRQIQSGHTGIKSRLWKVVKVDGVETERTLLHTDTYNASKAIVLVGPKAAQTPAQTAPAATQPAQTAPAETQPPVETSPAVVEGIHGGPGVTAPAATQAPQTEAPAPAPAETQPAPAPAPAETQPAAPAEAGAGE
ncbi:MAG: VanW family protein [Eubacteriales bacterium]|nr:VanW family protein [Eubacteriales bacterium]